MLATKRSSTRFKKRLIASMIGLAFAPCGVSAQSSGGGLDFAQAPPGNEPVVVAPNVILSLDDSGSMDGADMIVNGRRQTRIQVLKDALKETFEDEDLLPDNSIRLAWQNMSQADRPGYPGSTRGGWIVDGRNFNCVNFPNLGVLGTSAASNANIVNGMRVLDAKHRKNFLNYVNALNACGMTPTHLMPLRADAYMRAPLHQNGPWADIPGEKLVAENAKGRRTKPLGCRRNYHVLLTDGGWNWYTGSVTSPANYDGTARTLPNGIEYSTSLSQTAVYRDGEAGSIADWALKSWAEPLQLSSVLDGRVSPTQDYENAPATETVKNRITGKEFKFEKFWNPKYNPATWPHMVTFTIGFSGDALPQDRCSSPWSCIAGVTDPSSKIPYSDDGDLAEYASGDYSWRVVNRTVVNQRG